MAGVPAFASGPRPGWVGAGDLRCALVAEGRHRHGLRPDLVAALPHPLHDQPALQCPPSGPSPGWRPWFGRSTQQQPPQEVHAQHARMVGMLDEPFPQAAELLADVGPNILAFLGAQSSEVWSNNPQERLNREMSRWTDVVGIFSTWLRPRGSSGQSSPSSTTSGRSPATVCPLLPSMSAISTAWRQQCFCPLGQPDQSVRVTLLHHFTGYDRAAEL